MVFKDLVKMHNRTKKNLCRLKNRIVPPYVIYSTLLIQYRILQITSVLNMLCNRPRKMYLLAKAELKKENEFQQSTADPVFMSLAGYHLLSLLRVQQTPSECLDR